MKIEDIIRKYKKKIEYKTETVNDYKETHDPELLNSVPLYEKAIAEFELIVAALEKQVPKKPVDDGAFGLCPVCGSEFNSELRNEYNIEFCHHCGQRLGGAEDGK